MLVWRSVDYIASGFAMNVSSCWLLGLSKHHAFGASSDGFIHLFLWCFKGDINTANPDKPSLFNGLDSLLSTHGWLFSKSVYLSPAVTGTCCPTRSSRFWLLASSRLAQLALRMPRLCMWRGGVPLFCWWGSNRRFRDSRGAVKKQAYRVIRSGSSMISFPWKLCRGNHRCWKPEGTKGKNT